MVLVVLLVSFPFLEKAFRREVALTKTKDPTVVSTGLVYRRTFQDGPDP